MSSDLRLVAPSMAYEAQILAYREECWAADGHHLMGVGGLDELSVPEWLALLEQKASAHTCPEGLVPDSVYLCLRQEDDRLVGMINIRHQLNDYLREFGGHIGYAIRPGDRGRGYAKEQLRLGLIKCRELGIGPVLITCREDNAPSRRTILSAGGIYEDTRQRADGARFERYWINLEKGREQHD